MGWFARISIANRWVTILIALAIIGGSIFGTLQLKTELMPDIELPYVIVFAQSPEKSPEEVMTDISIPAEEAVMEVPGYKHIESTSTEGLLFIFATFEYGTDMVGAENAIEDGLRDSDFGEMLDAEDMIVTRISFEMMPLVWVTLSSNNDMTTAEVREVAEDLAARVKDVDGLLPEEEQTPFMNTVTIEGGEEDVLIIPNADAMNTLEVPMSWLVHTLQPDPENSPVYPSTQDIKDTHLLQIPTLPKVSEVAEVIDPVPVSYTNGNPDVSVYWMKDPEANTVDVANAITSKIEEFEASEDCPEDIIITTVLDQSTYIESSINDLTRDAIIGLILAGLVVILFLWAFRASLIIIVSIPFSILVAFLLMWAFDITVNVLTLSGLAIAIGRVVDDSIVSLENIYRHLQRGEGFRQAAIDGIREIAMPVISATVATVAIFIPLILVGGMVGEMFRPFGLTITFALLASLIAALILVPPLSSFMGRKKVSFEGYENWYTRLYTKTLRWSLGHRVITLLITIALFIASIFILPLVGTSFLHEGGEKMITVEIGMPYANDQELAQKVGEVEEKIEELDKVENYYSYLGSFGGGTMERGVATLQVDLTSDADMEKQTDLLRQKCDDIENTQPTTIKVIAGNMQEAMMGGGGLEVRVIGKEGSSSESLEDVDWATTTLYEEIKALESIGDIENLESELVINQDDISKEWKPAGLAQFIMDTGLSDTEAVTQLEREWILMRFGWPITLPSQTYTGPRVNTNGNTTGIYIPGIVKSLSESETGTISNLRIASGSLVDPTGSMKLGDLADLEWGPAEYRRAEGGYAGTITAAITVDDVGAVNREVQKMIDNLDLEGRDGIEEIKMGGIAEQMMEGFSDMGKAIGFAILIVFVILVISFRSWLTPLLIMVSLPLASIGAVLALLITGKTLGMSGMMGILMLVGIVLTNAIVLLTFVDDRRKEGYNTNDALMDAGRIRLRPILMTALTTMIALVPLAVGFGEGVLIAAELGVVVIGGLFSSTLLTLLVVPVLYSLTERLRRRAPSRSN